MVSLSLYNNTNTGSVRCRSSSNTRSLRSTRAGASPARWPHELQRIAVARALRPQTRYLIADEMTSMLDAVTQAQIWHVILDFVRRQKVGLLAISHEAAPLGRICDRTIAMAGLAGH